MLHLTDLSILASYCNEIGIYREIAQELQGNFTEQTVDKDGRLRSSKIAPKYKVMQNALQNAMKTCYAICQNKMKKGDYNQDSNERDVR